MMLCGRIFLLCFLCVVLAPQVQHVCALDNAYCFKFTWLGPSFDSDSLPVIQEKTCKELKLSPPCVEPLVITTDGTRPDTNYMWENVDRDAVTCKLTSNEVCLKWENYYNGKLDNITYTCGKMLNDKRSIDDGCEKEKKGAYMVKVCACRTPQVNGGSRIPCNTASTSAPTIWFSLSATILTLLAVNFRNQCFHSSTQS